MAQQIILYGNIILGVSLTQDKAAEDGEDQWIVWGKIVTDWDNCYKKYNAEIRELARRGIPTHFRAIAWQLLCSATDAPEKKSYAEFIKVNITK